MPKKFNLIPLIVTLILIGVVIYFLRPNKLITYTRAKLGVKNQVLIYKLDKNTENTQQAKDDLSDFLTQRGISGTAYEDKSYEYYVTIVPTSTNPKSEIEFGFKELSPEEFYKTVYNAKQLYFTRTLKVAE